MLLTTETMHTHKQTKQNKPNGRGGEGEGEEEPFLHYRENRGEEDSDEGLRMGWGDGQ